MQEFASHCAPEPPKGPAQMTIAQLRGQLSSLGLATSKGARKGSLVAQLQAALDSQGEKEASPEDAPVQSAVVVQGRPPAASSSDAQVGSWGLGYRVLMLRRGFTGGCRGISTQLPL